MYPNLVVSAIRLCWNRERFVAAALIRSVMGQTCADFELVVVDDGLPGGHHGRSAARRADLAAGIVATRREFCDVGFAAGKS
jgi:hypothetical protein